MIQLKQKDIKPWREERIKTITHCCLCGRSFEEKEPVADHCHITGLIRDVLCRNCNSMLGKIENAAIRAVGKERMLEFLLNSVNYVQHHRDNPSDLIHPTHNKPKKRKKKP